MRGLRSFGTLLLSAWITLPLGSQAASQPQLTLVKRISFTEVINDQGKALKPGNLKDTASVREAYDPQDVMYGFIRGGKAFTPGWGGWVLNLETGSWKQEYPAGLIRTFISRDGTKFHGSGCKGEKWEQSCVVSEDTLTGKPWPGDAWNFLHPDNQTTVDLETLAGLHPNEFGHGHYFGRLTINREGVSSAVIDLEGRRIDAVMGFTDDGRYLIFNKGQLYDTKAMKWVPMPELRAEKKPGERKEDGYIGDSETLVFNRDGSLVAGTKLEYDGFTFVWDRLNKHYKWKSTDSAMPSAFSNNGAYLLCEEVVVDASNGKVVFGGLKGERGKFSPNGRSLVTVDKLAFYVYTLPKESEPIFGVFQKPEPWSPAKAPAPKPKGKAKMK